MVARGVSFLAIILLLLHVFPSIATQQAHWHTTLKQRYLHVPAGNQ